MWWDLVSVPQADARAQRKAILSLCRYASLCSRFLPLVRDAAEWRRLYGQGGGGQTDGDQGGDGDGDGVGKYKYDGFDGPPLGTLETYRSRGWCRLELVAALCPKQFRSGAWRPGPISLRYRYLSI